MGRKLVFIAGFLIVAAFAAFMTVSMKRYLDRPTGKAWGEIHAFVKANLNDGDALAFFPPWLSGYATDNRRFRGMTGVAAKDLFPGEAGDAVFDRVWIISCFDDFDEKKMRGEDWTLLQKRRVAGAQVLLYERKSEEVSFRLSDRLREIGVSVRAAGAATPLAWKDDGFEFSDGSLKKLWADFRRLSRGGVSVPLKKKKEFLFDLGALPEGRLVLCGGVTDAGLLAMDFAPIDAVVRTEGGEPMRVRFEAKSGWYCSRMSEVDSAGSVQIRIASQAEKSRAFLFDLFVVSPPGEAPAGTQLRDSRT